MRPLRMANRYRIALSLAATAIFLNGLDTSKRLSAQEPCQEFLQVLREERLFEVAFEYLDEMQTSNLAGQDFKERIPLHKVAVLLDKASLTRDNAQLMSQLEKTENILGDFIETNPSATLLAEAQEQRARIFMARAGRLLAQADSDRLTIAKKNTLQDEARQYLGRANEAYESIRLRLRGELQKKLDPQNPNANSEREAMRNKYVLVRMQSPKIKEQIAESYGKDHPEFTRLLSEAIQQNLELYDKYRTRISGIDGCLGAARCYEKIGEPDKALGYLIDVFELQRGSVQAAKKREGALIAIDCWEKATPYPFEEAYQRLIMVIYSMSPDYGRSQSGIKIRMAYANACLGLVAKLKDNGGPADSESRLRMNNLEKDATRLLRILIRVPGDHRERAREMLKELGASVAAPVAEAKGPPETMADARQRGKDIQLQVSQLRNELKSANEAQAAELQKQIESQTDKALAMFDLALTMTSDETAPDDISNIRYLQCASYFQMDMHFESAIIGEYLLEKFPSNTGAQPAAGLVCQAYWKMYREAGKNLAEGEKPDRAFERQQLLKHSAHIFKTWPGSRQAEQAGLVMTLLSLSEGDADAAQQFLTHIPDTSPSRAAVVLEVGNRLWQSYVRGKKKGNVPESELLATRDQAQEHLANGVSFLTAEKASAYDARSALALAELYLESSKTDLAIEQLESAKVAPLDLIKNKHGAANDKKFRRDTFKTAIRAYLAKLRDGEDSLRWVEKSQAVLDALKSDIGDAPADQKQLSDILLTLAEELKQQFDRLENNEQRKHFADGLESFLAGIGTGVDDQNLMLLTGRMSSEIGQGLKLNGLDSQAKRFHEQAKQVYESLTKQKVEDARTRLEIQRGVANSLRGTGSYQEAIKKWGDILSDSKNRNFTTLQVEATRVYTDWGLEKGDTAILVQAIRGGEARMIDKKEVNTIMGWLNLAKAAQRSKKEALLAEAVYNMARCKFKYGTLKGQSKMQEQAIEEIKKYMGRKPDMGGQQWKSRIESLLAEMERDKG